MSVSIEGGKATLDGADGDGRPGLARGVLPRVAPQVEHRGSALSLSICCDLFHGFDWLLWTSGTPQERLGLLPAAQEHVLQQEVG